MWWINPEQYRERVKMFSNRRSWINVLLLGATLSALSQVSQARDRGFNQPGAAGNHPAGAGVGAPGVGVADPGFNQPGAVGNVGVAGVGVGAPGVGVADPGLNQPGALGNTAGVARRTTRRAVVY
jgi:hypothetical protein